MANATPVTLRNTMAASVNRGGRSGIGGLRSLVLTGPPSAGPLSGGTATLVRSPSARSRVHPQGEVGGQPDDVGELPEGGGGRDAAVLVAAELARRRAQQHHDEQHHADD